MHIKQAYQRTQRQQKSQPHSSRQVDRSTLIGSIHTGHINFPKDQSFFSDFKVRDEVKEAKDYVKTLKDGDILELKAKPWNASVVAPRKFSDFQKEESLKTRLLKIKLGFCDYKQNKNTINKIYEGTQTRNDYTGWNVSTYFDKKQKTDGHKLTNINAIQNSIRYQSTNLKDYKTIRQRYNQTVQFEKSYLRKNSQILQDLKSSYLFTNPNSSPEKTNANVFKMLDEVRRQKLKNSYFSQSDTQDSFNSSFKARLSPLQKSKILYRHFHTGAWEKNSQGSPQQKNNDSDVQQDNDQTEPGYCWSCCMNNKKDSKGCSYKVQDRNKMNLASFDHA